MSLSCAFDFEADEKIETNVRMFNTPSNTLWNLKEEWILDSKKPRNEVQKEDGKGTYHQITLTSEEAASYYAVVEIYDSDPNVDKGILEKCIDFDMTNKVRLEFSLYKEHFFKDKLPMHLRCVISLFPLFHSGYVQPTCLSSSTICYDAPVAKVESVEAVKNLSRDMKSLLEKGTFSDISLVCESTEVKVHKNILKVRAPWFYMLNINVGEIHNKVHIDDMDLVVLREMLLFFYTGKVTAEDLSDLSVIRRLRTVANTYDIKEIVDFCKSFLLEHQPCELLDDQT